MIVRSLNHARHTARCIDTDNWESTRLLLEADNMGFSFHITRIKPGTVNEFWYKNHLESVYCISGRGELKDLGANTTHIIEPGVMYALDRHDKHILNASTELVMACVFNPPLKGSEVHDKDGAYSLDADAVAT